MSYGARALVAVAAAQLVFRWRPGAPSWVAVVPVAVVLFPLPAAAGGVAWLVVRRFRKRAAARRIQARAQSDVTALAELTALGLVAGLDYAGALKRAAQPLSGEIRAEVNGVLRRARLTGLAPALADAGRHTRRFLRVAARAVDTGAPVRAAVEAYVDDAVADEHARRLAAVRRLPVKLLFPLALLILPGFMLLTVAPALLGSVRRLGL